MRPRPIRSGEVNNVSASVPSSRAPFATFSPMARRAGSRTRSRSSERSWSITAVIVSSVVEALDGESHVVTPEAGAVAQGGANNSLLRRIGREVEIAALRVDLIEIDRRRHALV